MLYRSPSHTNAFAGSPLDAARVFGARVARERYGEQGYCRDVQLIERNEPRFVFRTQVCGRDRCGEWVVLEIEEMGQ